MNATIVLWIAGVVVGHGYPFDKANILSQALFLHGRFNLLFVEFCYFGESEGYACLLLGVDVETTAPAQAVRESAVPLLLIHSEADSANPVEHARQIYAHADPATTELWLVPGGDHGQAHAIEGPRYEVRVRTFFEHLLCGAPV